jgi:hypothetical protein
MRKYIYIILILFISISTYAGVIQGIVKDSKTNEILIGVTVNVEELKLSMMTGLDGSFQFKKVSQGNYTLHITYMGYETLDEEIIISPSGENSPLEVFLQPVSTSLNEVVVLGLKDKSTDASARLTERESPNLMNIVSAKTIELSPDLDGNMPSFAVWINDTVIH